MPEGSVTFDVRAPLDKAWAFLSDMRKVGTCVPGVRSVELLDDQRARWNLLVKIGPLAQTFVVTTETLEQTPPRRGRFHGVADNLDIFGTIELAPSEVGTRVVYSVSVNAKGPLARIMDNFMRSRLKAQTDDFATNVKKGLEG